MKIRAIKLRIATGEGEFGFSFLFSETLTIIRARNSSGKSTLFNSLLYALGMEELVGGRDERVLPYAVQEYFEFDGRRINVVASEVLLEIENGQSEIATLRRAIKHEHRHSKLIEVFMAASLTSSAPLVQPRPTYLHDAGGAQREEGFHRFLEEFLGLNLPQVSTTSGGQTKLYLQTVFAALAVEQKRGWTDYIAGIPFYGIREARTRVVEYLLGLDVFEAITIRALLDKESVDIHNEWTRLAEEIQQQARDKGADVENLPAKPDPLFVAQGVQLIKSGGDRLAPLEDHISTLRHEYQALDQQANGQQKLANNSSIAEFEKVSDQLRELSYLHEQTVTALNLHRASLKEYELIRQETQEDLARNRTVQKLRVLGAQADISLALDQCPTCHQPIENSLLREAISGPLMSLDENISYLKSQCNMLEKQIAGTQQAVREAESNAANLARKVSEKQRHLDALRGDISSGAAESRAMIRRQVQIESEVEDLQSVQQKLSELLKKFSALATRMAENQAARKTLPKEKYSEDDQRKIAVFQKMFRANAGSFGYESADIAEIQIHRDTLTPAFKEIELREIAKKAADIVHNSSASDFVRLIWSYLLAIYQASSHSTVKGNHPGILLFDEPGQHSMRAESQNALLRELSNTTNLQSIVAASFDENKSVFEEATFGVQYQLIEWEDRLIRPLERKA
jgi:hypothetical protein